MDERDPVQRLGTVRGISDPSPLKASDRTPTDGHINIRSIVVVSKRAGAEKNECLDEIVSSDLSQELPGRLRNPGMSFHGLRVTHRSV